MPDRDLLARIRAIEILLEQLVAERCLATDDPEGTARRGATMLSRMIEGGEVEDVDQAAADALDVIIGRIVARVREAG